MKVLARLFSSRKVWIALAGVAGCLVVVLGADPAKWTPLITAIVTLAGTCIAAIGYEDGQAKSATGDQAAMQEAIKRASTTVPSFAIACLSLLLFGGGCADLNPFAAPTDRYVAADRSTYDTVGKEYGQLLARTSRDEAGNFTPIEEPLFTPDQVARRLRKLQTWDLRIRQAAGASTAAPAPASGGSSTTAPATPGGNPIDSEPGDQ